MNRARRNDERVGRFQSVAAGDGSRGIERRTCASRCNPPASDAADGAQARQEVDRLQALATQLGGADWGHVVELGSSSLISTIISSAQYIYFPGEKNWK